MSPFEVLFRGGNDHRGSPSDDTSQVESFVFDWHGFEGRNETDDDLVDGRTNITTGADHISVGVLGQLMFRKRKAAWS